MIIFVIPAYNEADNIRSLLTKTDRKMRDENLAYKIIIINDGSTDGTVKVVESFQARIPAKIYSHYPNKGVGEAFRAGFRHALEESSDNDIIITKEADNTSDLNIAAKLVEKIGQGYDLALASCYAKEGRVLGTTFYRLILSRTANFILKLFIPIKNVNTFSSFYRAYRAKSLRDLQHVYQDKLIEQGGFECMVELLMKFARDNRFKIAEVPMILNGHVREGKSKMKVIKTIKGFLKVIYKERIAYEFKRLFRHPAYNSGK